MLAATIAGDLREMRVALGISQSKLARMSAVSRFKICLHELGDGSLTTEERDRIQEALRAEAERLRNLSAKIEFGQPKVKSAAEVR